MRESVKWWEHADYFGLVNGREKDENDCVKQVKYFKMEGMSTTKVTSVC